MQEGVKTRKTQKAATRSTAYESESRANRAGKF
jgi:hypothetical protein